MQPPPRFSINHGIALGPILFIIAILAIIAAAIAAGTGGFNANTTNETTKANAEALVQYADQLRIAVQKIYVENGCADTQLQFQVTNPNAPTDGSCSIFDPRGGGIIDKNFTNLNGAFDTTQATSNSNWWGSYGRFAQNYAAYVYGVGGQTALLFNLLDVSATTCAAINQIVGYNAAGNFQPPSITYHITTTPAFFQGTYYNYWGLFDIGFRNGGGQQGCFFDSSGTEYDYVGVLLAR